MVEEAPIMDSLEIFLVSRDDHVKVCGSLQLLLELQLCAVHHPGHEVPVQGGGEVQQP